MDSELRDNDVYGLISQLCETIYHKQYQTEEHLYLPQQDNNDKHLKRLKAKAYEILLNKSNQDLRKDDKLCDPVIELLKYTYVLKVGLGRVSQATELQKYLDEFIDNGLDQDSVTYSTLQFLNCLKSYNSEDDSSLDIFHYGKPHPQLPEMLYNDNSIPPFQIYPTEAFCLPKKFESMLKQEHGNVVKYNAVEPGNKLTLLGRFTTCNSNVKNIRYNNDLNSISNVPKHTSNLLSAMDSTLSSYFVPQIKDVNRFEDQFLTCKEGIVTEPESPWQQVDPLQSFLENNLREQDNLNEIYDVDETEIEECEENLDKIWENMDKISPVSSLRTWETLGVFDPPKEPPFVSESIEATLHLMNVAQNNILSHQITSIQPVCEVSSKDFINHIKLLLLGVESNSFVYSSLSGFELKKNLVIHSISSGTLENICYTVTRWGTCYRNLSDLIVPDPHTDRLQIEGLIFKALCSSIKEFLLFYHAAILRVSITDEDGNVGLLNFLKKIRPLGNLIFKVSELCRCDSQRLTSLGEGIGILTHIYKEVTKVTEQNVALVFYSILKDCCEVYFRFLQHWIFEGVCVDIYEEFMIKVRPQYLRTRGHRFWTRGFSINEKSVPGFLSSLTDSILQCGKAVTLLKICDPQNPLCRLSASSQPPVRVCLNVGMLREQAKFYEDYETKGEIALGGVVSMYSAIQEEKEIEKKRAELVIAAQQDTLLRLKKEREEALIQITKEKSELLEMLKDQVEEVALRKKRDRDAELLADKLLMERIMKEEEEEKNLEKAERENTIKYYEELAEAAKKHRIRADWRVRRMKLFDERVLAISRMRQEFITTPIESEPAINFDGMNKDQKKSCKEETIIETNLVECDKSKESETHISKQENINTETLIVSEISQENENQHEEVVSEDENSNPTFVNIDETPLNNQNINVLDKQNQNLNVSDHNIDNQNSDIQQSNTKVIRPTVLDITSDFDRLDGLKNVQNTKIERKTMSLLNLKETDNMTEAQRNKLKVLQSEYGITPNNNESATILFSIENTLDKRTKLTEMEMNRLKNSQHLTHLNWNDIEMEKRHLKNADQTNEEKTEIQINRLRNTQHLTNLNWNDPQTEDSVITHKLPLTEAQINRNKIMSHTYNRIEEPEHLSVKTENLTDCQKNRNRNMASSIEQFDFETNKFTERIDHEHCRETPMSTTTDNFTVSTHSSTLHVQSCENTPFSEITNHSDMLFARSTDGLSTDDMSESRVTKHFQNTPVFPNFIGLGSVPNTPSESQQLTAADVEMLDTTSLHVYFEKSVVIPLTVQSRLVNHAIIKYMLNEHKMLSHLHSLRSYFFLLNGEFSKTLTQSLFTRLYEASSPMELFNSSTLTNFLEKALISSLSSTYTNSELLSLSATDVPTYLQTSNPEILNCLSLNYKISWPLNIIFNDVVMQQYSRVFKFLLMVGRVLWVLQEDFHILKIARKATITKNHHKLQLYRHSMMQFMNALHTYLTCSVLHASWSEFEKELENATTLDEVYDTHIRYIKKILSRCMLNIHGEKMRTSLCNIFKVVLKFHNRIRAQNWNAINESQSAGPNYENLERMYIAFCEQRAYLAHLAEKLSNSGFQPHLTQFLHVLSINHRYNLSFKNTVTRHESALISRLSVA